MKLTGGRVFDPQKGFVDRDVCVQDGLIAQQGDGESLDVSGCYVIPGLTDLHFHGCQGADFSDGDAAGLQTMADYELSRGVTQICPAGMTLDVPQLEKICRNAAAHKANASSGADLVGVNLEGPFATLTRRCCCGSRSCPGDWSSWCPWRRRPRGPWTSSGGCGTR